MWHLELPEMKATVVFVALLTFPTKVALNPQEKCYESSREHPAMLACDAQNQHVFQDRAVRNACDADSRCGWACDASAGYAKSLAMWAERCEPLRCFPSSFFSEFI